MKKKSKNIRPPKIALRFFRWFCNPDYVEDIEGDLLERFEKRMSEKGTPKAKWFFVTEVMMLFRLSIIKQVFRSSNSSHFDLIINHVKFTVRLSLKDKFYTFLNISGLTLGILCGIIVILYLQNDLTYDLHHKEHEEIYRLTNRIQMTGFDRTTAVSARELPPLIKEVLPELETFVRFVNFGEEEDVVTLTYDPIGGKKKQFYEENLLRADSNIFELFTHKFIAGNPKTCLTGLHKIVITQSMARKYFGDKSPLGEVLKVEAVHTETFKVSAVIEDLPDNSHLKFDFLVSNIPTRPWIPYAGFGHTLWNPGAYCYLKFPKDYDPSLFAEKFDVIFEKYYSGLAEELGGKYTPYLEPLAKVHFHSETVWDEPQGDISFVYTFATVGAFIVLLVCINYVNLSTARSMSRAREMGVRKVLGSTRKKLFYEQLIEAFILVIIAYFFAIVLSYFLTNSSSFYQLIGKRLEFNLFDNPFIFLGSFGLVIFIGLISGIYPGVYIPSVSTVAALKGSFQSQKSGVYLRKGLITFQFIVSTLIIICTVLMTSQLNYMKTKEVGFKKNNILILKIPDGLSRNQLQSTTSEFRQINSVQSVTYSTSVPGGPSDNGVFKIEKGGDEYIQHEIQQSFVGDDYLKTMGIGLLEGRDFHKDSDEDIFNSFLINEAVVRTMGWTDSPIGKKIRRWDSKELGSVIGIVKDYNFLSLHHNVEPMIIRLFREPEEDEPSGYFHIRINEQQPAQSIGAIEEVWGNFFSDSFFDFEFLDQKYDAQYKKDDQQQDLFFILSCICIFISLLGIVGLAAFTTAQKTKEIGIRKVLGASIIDVLLYFSKDYLPLIALATIIAIPSSNYLMIEWLDDFAYRLTIKWWQFTIPAIGVFMVALLAVAAQSIKTARLNPVDSLRNE